MVFDALINFAEPMVKKHGEFFPFAAAVGKDGRVAQVGAKTAKVKPEPEELIDLLTQALQADAREGRIVAAGICLNVAAQLPGYTSKVDAICCRVEHVAGEAVQIFVPFKKKLFGRVSFDPPVAIAGEVTIFKPSGRAV